MCRYQLGFALLLAELLPGLMEPLSTYDPAFDDVDKALLSNLGVAVRGSAYLTRASIPIYCFTVYAEGRLLIDATWKRDLVLRKL